MNGGSGMGYKNHGTVTVPYAGLTIRVETIATDADSVRLKVVRHGMPLGADLTRAEAEALASALLDALNYHAAGVAS